jgi:hypothetical protein
MDKYYANLYLWNSGTSIVVSKKQYSIYIYIYMFKQADFYRIQNYTLQDTSQLACYTVSTGKQPPTFHTNLTISYSGQLLGLLDLKDEATTILRNVGNGLPVDTA